MRKDPRKPETTAWFSHHILYVIALFAFVISLYLLTSYQLWLYNPASSRPETSFSLRPKPNSSSSSAPTPVVALPDLPSCKTLEDVSTGFWNSTTQKWTSSLCNFIPYTKQTMQQCLKEKTIGFYGDSTLRNIVMSMMRLHRNGKEDAFTMETWAPGPSFHCGGGKLEEISVDMWWTPSAFFQRPHQVGRMASDSVSIISISVWDMGTYFRGVEPWFNSMKTIILEAAKVRNGKPLFIMDLHRVYNEKCELKHDTEQGKKNLEYCRKCNGKENYLAFREALESAVKCVLLKGYDVTLVDGLGITNNEFAKSLSDGVHFEEVVTDMELQLLLTSICANFKVPESKIESMICPIKPDFTNNKQLECKNF